MRSFILSGTGPGAGRTTIGCALAFAFKVRGLRVGVMKPAATGCVEHLDAAALVAAASSDLPLELVAPYRYRAQLPPVEAAHCDGVAPPDFAVIDRTLGEIARRSDLVLVEDTHALAASLDATHDFADLALAHRLELILVVGASARRADFAEEAQRALDFAAERGVGVRGSILNALDREANDLVIDAAEDIAYATRVPILGTMRFKEPLSLAIVEELLSR